MPAEKNVLSDTQLGNQHEFLMNDINAEIVSLVRSFDLDRLALPKYFSRVSLISAADDLHESGLASAVLTNQCVHFTTTHVKGDVIEYDNAAERLRDVLHFED